MIDAQMMGGMPPPMMPEQGPPPMDENTILQMLMEQVLGRWAQQDAQLGGEKDVLVQTLLMLAQAGGQMPPDMMMEGGGMSPAGPPMEGGMPPGPPIG